MLHGALLESDRLSIKKRLELGEILTKARAVCNAGEWLPALKKVRIKRTTAWECITLFCSGANISSCDTLKEALRLARAIDDVEEHERQPDREPGDETENEPGSSYYSVSGPGATSDQGDAPLQPAKGGQAQPSAVVLCESCRRTGAVEDCEFCKALVDAASTSSQAPPGRPKRKRGSQSKNGAELFNAREFYFLWKQFHATVGAIVRAADAVAKAEGRFDARRRPEWENTLGIVLKQFMAWYKETTGREVPLWPVDMGQPNQAEPTS